VPLVLAPIAAPVWLADWLVTLAQSLVDAEANAHPERKTDMSALVRGQIIELLGPVEALLSEMSAMLADRYRKSTIGAPLQLAPYAQGDAGLHLARVPAAYVRGLLDGARSTALSVQTLAADYQGFFTHATSPDWLQTAFSGLQGELAAAQSRIDACAVRVTVLLHKQRPEEDALRDLANDLWSLITAVLLCGQQIAAPSLLPAIARRLAAALRPNTPPESAPALFDKIAVPQSAAPAVAQSPAPPPLEPPRALPDISIRPGSLPAARAGVPADPSPRDTARHMPVIGGVTAAASPHETTGSPRLIRPSRWSRA
jgi:hypothetical protein